MRAHTITTKVSTIVPGGILALSLAVVLLAATASTASAEEGLTERSSGAGPSSPTLSPWYCLPPATAPTTLEQVRECVDFSPEPSFGFGDRQVGTASPAQPFALGVFGNSFSPTISVSGDYAQTNNCPPTLSANALALLQGCLINVTFAPTGTGPRHGTLSTGPGGPTMALTGKGVTTPTPWDWPVELSVREKKQDPVIHPGGCDGPTPALTCGGNCEHPERCAVTLKASCGGGACTARAEGKLTRVKNDRLRPSSINLRPGEWKWLELKVPLKTRIQAGKALAEGKKVEAKVTVRATDAAGNVTTAKETIRIVK